MHYKEKETSRRRKKVDLERLQAHVEEGGSGGSGGVRDGDGGGKLEEVEGARVHADVGDVGRLVPLQGHVAVRELCFNTQTNTHFFFVAHFSQEIGERVQVKVGEEKMASSI